MIKSIQKEGPYQILGYSFGGCVAVEVALQLQSTLPSESAVKKVTLLDGSHNYVLSIIGIYSESLGSGDRNELETAMICAFVDHIIRRVGAKETTEIDIPELGAKIIDMPDLDTRLEAMCETLRNAGKISTPAESDIVRAAAKTFYQKLDIINRYKPQGKIESSVTLVRASGSSAKQDEDYGMRTICSSELSIEVLEGTHDTFFRGEGERKVLQTVNSSLL